MNTSMPGADKPDETGGTPETIGLTVKLLGDDWIVENAVGKSVGTAPDRESAIKIARQAAGAENASVISVLAEDGALERTVKV